MGRLKQWKPLTTQEPSAGDRLDSWKEIAAYLNRSVRTAQEWERHEGMPVHRQRHSKRGTVYALPNEIDAWWRSRGEDLGRQEPVAPILIAPKSHLPRRLALVAGIAALVIVAGVTGWYLAVRTTSREPLTAVPLTSYPGQEWLPALSPAGDRVAFLWNGANQDNMDIYVRQIGTEAILRLTEHPASDWAAAWSPDAARIAFLRTLSTGVVEAFLIPAIGGQERKIGEVLGPVGYEEACLLVGPYLTWTSDGRSLIVVDRDSTDEPFAIFALDLTTFEKHRLTRPLSTATGDSSPALSADGQTLAFHRMVASETSHLYLLRLTDDLKPIGEPTQLTLGSQLHTNPVWLQDDREILYTAAASRETGRLWRLDVGSPLVRKEVVGAGLWGWTPTVSQSARRMVYPQFRYARNVWRIDLAEGGGQASSAYAELNSTFFDSMPSWSPDGQRVMVVSDRTGQRAIWLFAADGTRGFPLTEAESKDATWSPDGKVVAFICRGRESDNVCVIEADGQMPRMLTSDPGNESDPRWSSDGKWIYFTSDRGGKWKTWKIPAGGGAATVTALPLGSRESPDGKFFYYDSGEGIWRIPKEDGPREMIIGARSMMSAWKITPRGIYYVAGEVPCCRLPEPSPTRSGPPLMFSDFVTGETERIAVLHGYQGGTIDVHPNRSTVMYTRLDQFHVDLMLVEHFE